MNANKSVLSALLGVALLAVPITASAHDHGRHHGWMSWSHKNSAYRSEIAPRANWAPRLAENDRLWMRPSAPMVPVAPRGYYPSGPAYNAYQAPLYNSYPNNYGQGYYPEPYYAAPSNYGAPFLGGLGNYGVPGLGGYGAPIGGGMANLIRQRDNAQILYQQAVRNGNRDRAKHLLRDMIGLNKQIANARTHDGYGRAYGSFNPNANAYGNGYGYGNSGLNSYGNGYGYGNSNLNALGPMLRNFIP